MKHSPLHIREHKGLGPKLHLQVMSLNDNVIASCQGLETRHCNGLFATLLFMLLVEATIVDSFTTPDDIKLQVLAAPRRCRFIQGPRSYNSHYVAKWSLPITSMISMCGRWQRVFHLQPEYQIGPCIRSRMDLGEQTWMFGLSTHILESAAMTQVHTLLKLPLPHFLTFWLLLAPRYIWTFISDGEENLKRKITECDGLKSIQTPLR